MAVDQPAARQADLPLSRLRPSRLRESRQGRRAVSCLHQPADGRRERMIAARNRADPRAAEIRATACLDLCAADGTIIHACGPGQGGRRRTAGVLALQGRGSRGASRGSLSQVRGQAGRLRGVAGQDDFVREMRPPVRNRFPQARPGGQAHAGGPRAACSARTEAEARSRPAAQLYALSQAPGWAGTLGAAEGRARFVQGRVVRLAAR